MSSETERVIAMLGEQINEQQAMGIRRLSDRTRHGYKFIDVIVRKDGVETRHDADWIANLLNPRGPA